MADTSVSITRAVTPSRLRWLLAALGLGILFVLGGCGNDDGETSTSTTADAGGDGGEVSAGEPVLGGAISYGLTGETDGWLPSSNRWGPSAFNVARAIYDPLTAIDTEGIAQPYLLESIEPSENLREWTLTLREGVRYHNGDEMTKEDLATFIKTMQLAPLTSFAFGPVDAVAVLPDQNAIVVIMNQPWGTFPAILSSQPGYMINPGLFDGTIPADEPVGTGPFVWDEWIPGDRLTVTRNDDYWRDGLPYLDQIDFKPIVDPATRMAALQAGDIDVMQTNSASQLVDAGRDGENVEEGFQVVLDGSAGDEQLIILNTQSGPTADPEVRRALALATDREALNDALYDGFFEVASSPFAPGDRWYSDPGWPDPDPDEAARIVEEWEAENGPLAIDYVVIAAPENLRLAQAVQEQWAAIGVEAKIDSIDEASFSNRLLFGEAGALQIQFFNRSDPDELFHFLDPEAITGPGELSLNFARYGSDVMSENLTAARESNDFDVRYDLYAEIWEDWATNFPYLFLFHAPYILMARDNVQDLGTFTFPDGEPAAAMDWGAVFLTDVWLSN